MNRTWYPAAVQATLVEQVDTLSLCENMALFSFGIVGVFRTDGFIVHEVHNGGDDVKIISAPEEAVTQRVLVCLMRRIEASPIGQDIGRLALEKSWNLYVLAGLEDAGRSVCECTLDVALKGRSARHVLMTQLSGAAASF
jgi:hypothetical protein